MSGAIQWIWDNWDKLATVVGAIAGAGGAVWGIFRRAINNFTSQITYFNNEVKPMVTLVQKELSANGGSSLYDRISKIEQVLSLMVLRWRVVDGRSDVGTFEADAQGAYTYANNSLCEIFGLPESEMLQSGWLKAVHHNRSRVWTKWLEHVKQAIPYEDEYTIETQSGKVRIRAIAIPQFSKNKLLCFSGTVQVIQLTE